MRDTWDSFVLVDTPGQIEVFTWSASGQIISDSFACTYPTVVTYVADTVRCQSVTTFMSNMLYALSIMYKTKLPLLVTFNKIDVAPHQFAIDWVRDYEKFEVRHRGLTPERRRRSRKTNLTEAP